MAPGTRSSRFGTDSRRCYRLSHVRCRKMPKDEGEAMARRKSASIGSLDVHPNLPEILGVLAQLPHITDSDLERLADAWHNTVALAEARARALDADSPLVLEVLSAFEAVQSLFADDVSGECDYLQVE